MSLFINGSIFFLLMLAGTGSIMYYEGDSLQDTLDNIDNVEQQFVMNVSQSINSTTDGSNYINQTGVQKISDVAAQFIAVTMFETAKIAVTYGYNNPDRADFVFIAKVLIWLTVAGIVLRTQFWLLLILVGYVVYVLYKRVRDVPRLFKKWGKK